MGEDWGDAASRLAALREVRTKMMMIIVVMMVVMMAGDSGDGGCVCESGDGDRGSGLWQQ